MASIERTAYPRFRRVVPLRELHEVYEPSLDEVDWARGLARPLEHLLTLVLLLKCFQRLGYFPKLDDVPEVIVAHVRGCLGLPDEVRAAHDSDRTLWRHREFVRPRLRVVYEPERARAIAAAAIRTEAAVKDNPADLINVALEELIRARCELPGYTTLDEMAARIRAEVNGAIFRGIGERMTCAERAGLEVLLEVDPRTRRSDVDRLKQPAKAATLTRFREHLAFVAWADSLGASERCWKACPPRRWRTSRGRQGCWTLPTCGRWERRSGSPSSPACSTSPGAAAATR